MHDYFLSQKLQACHKSSTFDCNNKLTVILTDVTALLCPTAPQD